MHVYKACGRMLARSLRTPTTFAPHHLSCASVLLRKMSDRKPGVATPEELRQFVQQAGTKLLVVDVRNPDASVEPGDQKSFAVAPLPSSTARPHARHLIYDRDTKSMALPNDVPKDTPIITHCGAGGRGQEAKEFLEQHGFTNVLNGGGPKDTECWQEYGSR